MRDMPELKVEEAAVADLAPYARNAKAHTREQVAQIAKSIEEFGFNDPVAVWDGPDGTEIVEGHGRVMAAKKLGLKRVPIVRLDHLTDEQRRAYTHIHNQLTLNTGWETDMLASELGELGNTFDFEDFGFTIVPDKEFTYEVVPEVEFTESLEEENNYIVLKFDNHIDWLNAQTVFDVKPVRNLSTRKDGKVSEGMSQVGTGRVIDGAKAINRILGKQL